MVSAIPVSRSFVQMIERCLDGVAQSSLALFPRSDTSGKRMKLGKHFRFYELGRLAHSQ
jgi:hypothetical protein